MILILYLWGSCIAYLVIIGDSFSPLLALATGTRSLQMSKQPVLHTRLSDALYHGVIDWQPVELCHVACAAETYHSLNKHLSKPILGLNTFQIQMRGIDVVVQAQIASWQTGGL